MINANSILTLKDFDGNVVDQDTAPKMKKFLNKGWDWNTHSLEVDGVEHTAPWELVEELVELF